MKARKQWIGRWLIGVAVLHTIFGAVMGREVLAAIVQRGVVNSVGADAMTGVFVWFLLCGAVLALLGLAVNSLERAGRLDGARTLGIGTVLLTVVGVVLMPASGFWLVFPPAIGLMRRGS